jgi:hypothetical protein
VTAKFQSIVSITYVVNISYVYIQLEVYVIIFVQNILSIVRTSNDNLKLLIV